MTPQDVYQLLLSTGRVLPLGQTHHTGLLLPNGRFFVVRRENSTETHDGILNPLGLSVNVLMSRYDVVRKNRNTYQFDYDNTRAQDLIQEDIKISGFALGDRILLSNHVNGKFDYEISYQQFLNLGGFLPDKPRRTTYFA